MRVVHRYVIFIFSIIVFGGSGLTFIVSELERDSTTTMKPPTQYVSLDKYQSTANLTKMKGESIIGMVPFALAGDFSLTIDGILINEDTDISMIDLRGVPQLTYTITLYRQNGIVNAVTAVH